NGHGPLERPRVPVHVRHDAAARCLRYPGLLAMILAPLGVVQRPQKVWIDETIDLAVDRSRHRLEGGRIAAEIEEQSRRCPRAQARRSPLEQRMEAEATHEGTVREQEILPGHGSDASNSRRACA